MSHEIITRSGAARIPRRRPAVARGAAVALGALALALALSGCFASPSPATTASPTPIPTMGQPMPTGDGTLVVGAAVPLTGADGGLGAASLAGVELAVRDIDEAGGVGGVPVLVLHADAATADTAVATLDGRDVDAIVGPNASGLLAGVDAAAASAEIPGLSASAEAVTPDAAFLTRLQSADPTLTESRFGAESYDATVMIALAASLAGDDGRASIAQFLPAITTGSVECSSYGACLEVLKSRADIRYTGVTGQLALSTGTPAPGALTLLGLVP